MASYIYTKFDGAFIADIKCQLICDSLYVLLHCLMYCSYPTLNISLSEVDFRYFQKVLCSIYIIHSMLYFLQMFTLFYK